MGALGTSAKAIKKVSCNSDPGTALVVQKVVSVQDGSKGQCDYGLTTFQDDPHRSAS
jgi:hypothetical protein